MRFKLNIFFLLIFLIFSNSYISSDCFFLNCVKCDSLCDSDLTPNIKCDDVFGKTFFSMRPQDSNSARRLMALGNIDFSRRENINNFINVSVEFQQSLNHNAGLSKWFLFNGADCMTVGIPSTTETFDADGSQFGLSLGNSGIRLLTPGQIGNFCIDPVIKNIIFDVDFGFDLSRFICGLWAQADFVFAQNRTDLRVCQTIDNPVVTSQDFFGGLFELNCATVPVPYDSIICAFQGNKGFGQVPPLLYGKFAGHTLKKTGLAGIHVDLGYDLLRHNNRNLSLAVHAVIPTGNAPEGKYLLEPVIGANKSAQIGATMQGSYIFWDPLCDNSKRLGFYFDLVGTHLFKAKQTRLFALKNNGPGSQYLLLKTFVFIGQDSGSSVVGAERAANILAGETKIGADFMFDGSAMLQLDYRKFFGKIGYNFWLRTKEKKSDTVCFRNFTPNTYGIKGNSPLTQTTSFTCEQAFICASNFDTESQSTIGQPSATDDATTFIGVNDIDFSAPLHPTAFTNKFFGAVGYDFDDACGRNWFFQIGAEYEFSPNNKAVNQWGILGQFGLSY